MANDSCLHLFESDFGSQSQQRHRVIEFAAAYSTDQRANQTVIATNFDSRQKQICKVVQPFFYIVFELPCVDSSSNKIQLE